jgi:hypothetical protein
MRRALEALVMKWQTEGKETLLPWMEDFIERGEARGRIAEAAHAVLTALRVRGIPVPDAARERILAEKDLPRLERWFERAILAATVAEVLDEPS